MTEQPISVVIGEGTPINVNLNGVYVTTNIVEQVTLTDGTTNFRLIAEDGHLKTQQYVSGIWQTLNEKYYGV